MTIYAFVDFNEYYRQRMTTTPEHCSGPIEKGTKVVMRDGEWLECDGVVDDIIDYGRGPVAHVIPDRDTLRETHAPDVRVCTADGAWTQLGSRPHAVQYTCRRCGCTFTVMQGEPGADEDITLCWYCIHRLLNPR